MKTITNISTFQKNKLALSIAASLLISGHALADESPAKNKELKLEVIEVTATKRVESIQDVPMSITAINGSTIEEAGIKDLSEMSAYIPNLSISEGAVNTNIYMRGVGSGINRSFEQSVGMFIDGIYMGRGKQFRAPFMDLERAEVLRGPQGLLFGKNTIAGTINLSTAKADAGGDFEGKVSVDLESEYSGRNITAVLATGLTDELGIRLAVKSTETDGYMTNTFTNKDNASEQDIVRLAVHWQPSAELNAHLKVEHSESSVAGTNAQLIKVTPRGDLANLVYGTAQILDPQINGKKDLITSTDEVLNPETRDVEADNISLNIDYALGEGTLTMVAGYSAYESAMYQDVDFMPVTFINTNDMDDFDQSSIELRYASSGENTFDYITGIYYQENTLDLNIWSNVDYAVLDPLVAGAFQQMGMPPATALAVAQMSDGFTRTSNYYQETDTISAFFQGTYNVTDDFRIIAGGRYTMDSKTATRNSINATADSSIYDSAVELTPATAPILPSLPANLDYIVLSTALSSVMVTDPVGGGTRDEKHFIPSLKFQYDLNRDVMFYGGIEQGFKSGGFNSSPDATDENNEFEDEEAVGLELGFKADLLDSRARLNVALFRSEFDNLQVTTWNGFSFEVGNAAESISQGFEVDGSFLISETLTFSGSFSYLDSYYKSYATGPCTAEAQAAGATICDLSDKETPFAPKISASLFLDYVTEVGSSMEFKAQLNVNYKDDFFFDTDLDTNLMQSAHTKVNMRIALADIDETWEIALIGKNLTDELTFAAGLDVPLVNGGYMGYTDAPRMISLQGTLRF